MASVRLSDNDVNDFERDGAVCLRGVFDDRWLELAREGIRKNIAEPGPGNEALRAQGGDGVYFNDYCNWRRIQELHDYVIGSPAKEIAGRLMRSTWAAFYHEHVLVKDAGAELETPWHQDQPYYPVDGDKVCSIWMPVDPVGLESTIQFVAGSHRWGKWFFPRKFATSRNYPLQPSGGREFDHDYEDVPEVRTDAVLKWALQPGDCIVFHMRTLHGAPGNRNSSVPRRVLSTRWLGDDAVMARRMWEVSPPTYGGLSPGDAAVSDEFPILWRAATYP